MLVYNHTFKFRSPYQVLLDDQIILDANNSKYDIKKALERTLQDDVKPMITQCCISSLYATKNQDAIDLAKSFERRRCNHSIKDPKEPGECIIDIVDIDGKNKHRYIVATQDIETRRKLRRTPGVPLVHVSRSVMIMEPISDASFKTNQRMEKDKLTKGLNDPKHYTQDIEKENKSKDSENNASKKRKGPKGPNPLSMKKKKGNNENMKKENGKKDNHAASQTKESGDKKRRRRRHNKSDATKGGETVTKASDANTEA